MATRSIGNQTSRSPPAEMNAVSDLLTAVRIMAGSHLFWCGKSLPVCSQKISQSGQLTRRWCVSACRRGDHSRRGIPEICRFLRLAGFASPLFNSSPDPGCRDLNPAPRTATSGNDRQPVDSTTPILADPVTRGNAERCRGCALAARRWKIPGLADLVRERRALSAGVEYRPFCCRAVARSASLSPAGRRSGLIPRLSAGSNVR
jgi:hypothetical protein